MSSLSSIKRLAKGGEAKSGELKGLSLKRKPATHAIDAIYVVEPTQKNNLTARQKKLKARKVSRQSRMYNLRKAK